MPTINSFVRFLQASPGAPAVDIYTDGDLAFQNVAYNELTEFLVVGPEDMHIQVFAAGEETNPLIDTQLTIPASENITVAIIGTPPDVSLLPIFLSVEPTTTDDGLIRLAHLSPTAPNVNLSIEGGPTLFSDVGYTQVTDFTSITPDSYNLQLRSASDDEVILTAPLQVMPRQAYTVYAIGIPGELPPLELGHYQDQIPFIGNTITKTEFRKTSSGKPLQITFTYK